MIHSNKKFGADGRAHPNKKECRVLILSDGSGGVGASANGASSTSSGDRFNNNTTVNTTATAAAAAAANLNSAAAAASSGTSVLPPAGTSFSAPRVLMYSPNLSLPEFKRCCGEKLGHPVTRVFLSTSGGEIDTVAQLSPDDVLVCTAGATFLTARARREQADHRRLLHQQQQQAQREAQRLAQQQHQERLRYARDQRLAALLPPLVERATLRPSVSPTAPVRRPGQRTSPSSTEPQPLLLTLPQPMRCWARSKTR